MGVEKSKSNSLEDKPKNYIKQHFQGIKFLWKTTETKYFLKLILLLLFSMVVLYGILYLLYLLLGGWNLTMHIIYNIGNPVLLGIFLYLMVDLIFFYKNSKKFKLTPEKNKYLQMKYWSAIKTDSYKKLRKHRVMFLLLIIVISIFVEIIQSYLISANLIPLYITLGFSIMVFLSISSFFIMAILAFMATKGAMESFENRFSKKFHKKWYWSFLLLPIPWLLFIIIAYYFQYIRTLDLNFAFIIAIFGLIFLVLGIIGFLMVIKRNWRSGYTISQISAVLTIVLVVIIPFIIEQIIGIMGPIASFIALVYFFIQGSLNEKGNKLNEYYKAWDNKLYEFNINSEQDMRSQKDNKSFESTPLHTDVPNAVSDLAVGLIILTYVLFVFFYVVMGAQLLLIGESGTFMISSILYFISLYQNLAIIVAIIIFTGIIIKRQAKKYFEYINETSEQSSYLICPNCKQKIKKGNFCEKCGTRLTTI